MKKIMLLFVLGLAGCHEKQQQTISDVCDGNYWIEVLSTHTFGVHCFSIEYKYNTKTKQ